MRAFDSSEAVGKLSGNLPHWRQDGTTYFVTFRTADSLPQDKLDQWLSERSEWLAKNPEPHSEEQRREYYEHFTERMQKWLDVGSGACVLRQARLRSIVENALHHFDGDRYQLDDLIVMPNHVHVLVTPLHGVSLSSIVQSWKSFTAKKVNAVLHRKGAFWQKESFDHIVRNAASFEKFRQYIRDNPKNARKE